MEQANIASIIAFQGSLLLFGLFWTTPDTHKVMTYFIPDLTLSILNMYITFWLSKKSSAEIESFLQSLIVRLSINLGYYINLASAVFYAALFVENTYLHTGLMSAFDKLWLEFDDIMKFKIPATVHAITLKLYSDELLSQVLTSNESKLL